MLPFFSPKQNGAELAIGRAIVTAFALLFLFCGLAKNLPSGNQLSAFFQKNALAEYETVTESAKDRNPILEEFYDRPSDNPTDTALSDAERSAPDTLPEPQPKESGNI